ncbi:MAG: hypothetical protein Kow00128_16280 [Deltaproteobacteria bacterium]
MTGSPLGPLARRARVVLPALLLVMVAMPGSPAKAADPGIEVGQPVPEFVLPGLDGKGVSFERQIRGKAALTLLFFMTTACSACYEELRELDAFLARHPGKVDAWAVAVDLRGAKTVAPYQKTNRFRVRYLIDPKFSLPRKFGFTYTPSLVIVSPRGVVLHKKGGYSADESIPDLMRAFLR